MAGLISWHYFFILHDLIYPKNVSSCVILRNAAKKIQLNLYHTEKSIRWTMYQRVSFYILSIYFRTFDCRLNGGFQQLNFI